MNVINVVEHSNVRATVILINQWPTNGERRGMYLYTEDALGRTLDE